MTIRIDQIGQAILNAPGATVVMLNAAPTTTRSTTSTSFVDIGSPAPGDIYGTFLAPVAGTYVIEVRALGYGSGGNWGFFQAVFDYDTVPVSVGDNSWLLIYSAASSYQTGTFVGTVSLSAGQHKVKVQWKASAGTIYTADGLGNFKIQGTLVSGSGAGGVLNGGGATLSSAQTGIGNGSWVQVTGLDTAVLVANERITVEYRITVDKAGTGGTCSFAYSLDSGSRTTLGYGQGSYGIHFGGAIDLDLTVGLHTVKWWVYFDTGSSNVVAAGSAVQITQYRGGLVPIQNSGTDVIAAPRALNFIGSGMSVSADTGVANIQLNEALTAPGVSIDMLKASPSTAVSIGSGQTTYVDIDANLANVLFTVPTAGTYSLTFKGQFLTSGTGCDVKVQCLFDEGGYNGFPEQAIGDEATKSTVCIIPANSSWETYILMFPAVALEAGTHQVNLQWKFFAGTGSASTDTPAGFHLRGTLVSGSGAGGTLLASADASSNPTTIGSATYADVPGLSVSIDVSGNETVMLVVTGEAYTASQYNAFMQWVDGSNNVLVPHTFGFAAAANQTLPLNWTAFYTFPVAGTYTVKLQAKYQFNSFGLYDGRIQVLRFRGGLVPVRDNGAPVIDTPAAIDFVGQNVQVVNVGGTAKVNVLAANAAPTTWSYLPSAVPTGCSGQVRARYQFDGTSGELLDRSGNGYNLTAGAAVRQISIGGLQGIDFQSDQYLYTTTANNAIRLTGAVTVEIIVSRWTTVSVGDYLFAMAATGETLATNYLYSLYYGTAGKYTGFAEYGSGTDITVDFNEVALYQLHLVTLTRASDGVTWKLYIDGTLASTVVASNAPATSGGTQQLYIGSADAGSLRWDGGIYGLRIIDAELTASQVEEVANQVRPSAIVAQTNAPENVPILSYLSSSQVGIQAAPGASPSLRFLMNDGVRYIATSPLVLSLATTGLGGLDTGTETASTWYYVYAVPDATAGLFNVVASATPPPAGPTGYPVWRYLGAIRNDGSSNIVKFYQVGSTFSYMANIEPATIAGLTKSANRDPALEFSISDVVPATAGNAMFNAFLQLGGTTGQGVGLELHPGGDVDTTSVAPAASPNAHLFIYTSGSAFDTVASSTAIQTKGASKTIGYRVFAINAAGGLPAQHSAKCSGWIDGYLSGLSSQLQAQYQPDTAIPQLAWTANSRVTVAAAPGQSPTVRTTLQDGIQRSFTGTLTWDPSTGVLDGGLDTGVETVSTWYYLYLVPRYGADTMLHVRGSANPPSTGPSGYANWRYLGAVRNNASGNLIAFSQAGSRFMFSTYIESAASAALGTSFQDPKIDLSMVDVVPLTAAAMFGISNSGNTGTDASFSLIQELYVYGQTSPFKQTYMACVDQYERVFSWYEIPIVVSGGVPKIQYRTFRDGGSSITINVQHVLTNGWVDSWLGGAATGNAITGANGTLVTSKNLLNPDSNTDGDNYKAISDLSMVFTSASGEHSLLQGDIRGQLTAVPQTQLIAYRIDGGPWIEVSRLSITSANYDYYHHFNVPLLLAAGVHTVDIGHRYGGGSGLTSNIYPFSWTSIWQFRGGLVPVQKDGVEVINTPQAYNFTGDNVQVTGAGGKANIAFNGVAEGTTATQAVLASDFPVTDTEADITGLSCSFTTVQGENVVAHFQGSANKPTSGAFLCQVRLYLDGVEQYYDVARCDVQFATVNLSFSVPLDNLSAGSHTVKATAQAFTSETGNINGGYDGTGARCTLSVIQYRGGYVQPENIPILSYLSSSQVRAQAAPGTASTLRLQLNDGARYQATSPLTLDLTASGIGGLDTGTEAASTWYYVYAVPSPTSGQFGILCSATPPPTGPTGYPVWRYLGAVRNNSGSNIVKFYQNGGVFTRAAYDQVFFRTTTDISPVSVDLTGYVPATSGMFLGQGFARTSSPGDLFLRMWANGDQGGTPAIELYSALAFEGDSSTFQLATPASPKSIYRQIVMASGTIERVYVRAMGWIDGYLAGLSSQLQAQFQPDTLQPQLAWRGNSQVDVLPSPGQPSTVLLRLQDGKQRSFAPSLSWNPSLGAADGGLDIGTEQVSSWYYLYLVPRSGADDFLAVRGSLNSPPTGPAGYTNWRYIGAVRNNATSNLVRFWQNGGRFNTGTVTLESIDDPSGSAITAVDMSAAIPLSALNASMSWKCYATSGYVIVKLYVDGYASAGDQRYHEGWVSGEDENAGQITIPTPTAPKRIYRQIDENIGSGNARYWELECDGWLDGYLGSAAGLGGGGPIGNTLDGAYNQGGAGAGRTIMVDAGAVEMDASGGDALNLDGYLGLTEIPTPASVANRGFVYVADAAGTAELCYRDDQNRTIQITRAGTIDASFVNADSYQAKVSSADTTPGYLQSKISAGAHLVATKLFPGSNEQLRLALDITGLDGYDVKVSATDTTPGFLQQKLVAGNNIVLTQNNPGGNETLTVGTTQVLKLDEQVSDPVQFPNDGYLYTKDDAGDTELFYRDSYGNILQISKAGRLDLPDGYISFRYDELPPSSTTGSETALTLAAVPVEAHAVHVFRNGALMRPVGALGPSRQEYTLSGDQVAFQPTGSPGDWYSALYIDGYMLVGAGGSVRQNVAMANNQSTDSASDMVVGAFPIAAGDYPSRTIKFLATAFVTNAGLTGSVGLYNLTDSVLVSSFAFTGLVTAKQISSALNLPVAEKMYEVRISVTGGSGPSDRVVCMWAGLQIG